MKHAYLIIAHNDFYVLEYMLRLIDDSRNDIYLHIDKKVDNNELAKVTQRLNNEIKKSKLYIYTEYNIKWGDKTQVECEIFLMKQARDNEEYAYYHILSGVDMPIKTQDQIHDFFNRNYDKEFLHFDSKEIKEETIKRVRYRHFLASFYKKYKNKFLNKLIFIIDNILVDIQEMFNIQKKIKYKTVQKGCNWCSITDKLVNYILEKENEILELVKYSKCADEVFIHTLVVNSLFINKLYDASMNNDYNSCKRLIIWDSKKTPHTFNEDDYCIIKNSSAMFARKFNSNHDKNIIEKIYKDLKGEN